jgi:hypothetical protein
MRRTNINAVLKMTRDFLDGRMDSISYWLDFPYEVTKRYQKMLREDPDLTDMIYVYLLGGGTDMIYVYLLGGGTDLHSSLSDEEFRALIQRQYDEVMDGVY